MSEIRVDTISEKTSANGVAVDGVTIKDGNVGATGTATSVAGIPLYRGDGNNSSIYTKNIRYELKDESNCSLSIVSRATEKSGLAAPALSPTSLSSNVNDFTVNISLMLL